MDITDRLIEWIKEQVEAAGSGGAVFGLSGGLDSSVVGALCSKALGERSLGVIMPCHSNPIDLEDARLVADRFNIKVITVDLSEVFDCLLQELPYGCDVAVANLKPRLRMATLYYLANDMGYLVFGTGNKSEISVGYFTKYGDGGADIFPLAEIYKTDLLEIAKSIGIPERIILKSPSAGLWEGQTDEGELGVSYEELDGILKALQAGRKPEFAPELVERIERKVKSSEHKRTAGPHFYPWIEGPNAEAPDPQDAK